MKNIFTIISVIVIIAAVAATIYYFATRNKPAKTESKPLPFALPLEEPTAEAPTGTNANATRTSSSNKAK